MTLRNPGFLYLLALLIVPLVLYLLPLPRRRIASAAVYLWQRFLRGEPFGGASDRLRRALGFTLIAVALLCLILAAADWMIGSASIDAKRVVVLIDASPSMGAVVDGRTSLDRATEAAAALIDSLPGEAEVAVVVAGDQFTVPASMAPAGQAAVRAATEAEVSSAPVDLPAAVAETHRVFAGDPETQLYVFTDAPLSGDTEWADRAHAWVAPPAGGNVAVTDLTAVRRGKRIDIAFTFANFTDAPRKLAGTVATDRSFRPVEGVDVPAGGSVRRTVSLPGIHDGLIEVRIDDADDALASDDSATIDVTGAETRAVRVNLPAAARANTYVSAVLLALAADGVIHLPKTTPASPAADVYVNHAPDAWPETHAAVLYPLRGGAVKVAGLAGEPVTIDRQADHPLLAGVDLRGLVVKGAVAVEPPEWAAPIAWAGDMPVLFAGVNGKSKVLIVAIPPSPTGSRWPLAASFPVLMRNTLTWMLPPAEAIGVLSASESDLRRSETSDPPVYAARTSLATILVALAVACLLTEWALVHKRLTE